MFEIFIKFFRLYVYFTLIIKYKNISLALVSNSGLYLYNTQFTQKLQINLKKNYYLNKKSGHIIRLLRKYIIMQKTSETRL